jgi:probable F420-dependent oxidoreductase
MKVEITKSTPTGGSLAQAEAKPGKEHRVKLGLVLPPCIPGDILWPAVQLADEIGFDSLWVTDRTVAQSPWLDCLTLLGGVAAVTKRATIGTAVLIPARRNPVLLAHSLATVDYLSNGRLIAGFGLGEYGLPGVDVEYGLAGIDPHQRGKITDEYIGLFRHLWSEEVVDFEGKYYQCQGVSLNPRPAKPIPIWTGSSRPAAIRRAARLGDGWLANFMTPEQFAPAWQQLQHIAFEAGRDPATITPAMYLFAGIGQTREEATAVLGPGVQNIFGAPLEQMSFACLYGTPDEWIERIEQFAKAGVKHLTVSLYSADLQKDVQLIGEKVLPALATLGG